MKNYLLLLLMVLATNTYAQISISDLFKSDQKEKFNINYPPQSNIEKAGFYLHKSAQLQYASLGVGIASIGTIVSATLINDKYEIDTQTGIVKKEPKSVKTGLIMFGAVTFAAAVCCELISINYKLKAGKYLQMRSNGTEGSIAFIF